MHADEITSRFGVVSAPGRRNKKAKKNEDADGQVSPSDASALKVTGAVAHDPKYVDPKLSRNILRLAREQQQEIEQEEEGSSERNASTDAMSAMRHVAMPADDDDSDSDGSMQDTGELGSDEEDGDVEEYEELDIDPEDAALMERFGNEDEGVGGTRNLADLIMAKIEAAEKQGASAHTIHEKGPRQLDGAEMPMPPGINPKVIEVYTK